MPQLDEYVDAKRHEAGSKLNAVIDSMEQFKKDHGSMEMTPSMFKGYRNNTILNAAVALLSVDAVKRLIRLGADPDARGGSSTARGQARNTRHNVYQNYVREEESGGETKYLFQKLEKLDKILEAMGEKVVGLMDTDSTADEPPNQNTSDESDLQNNEDQEGHEDDDVTENVEAEPGPSQDDLDLLKEVVRKLSAKSGNSKNKYEASKADIGSTLRLKYGDKFKAKDQIRSFFRRVLSSPTVQQFQGGKNKVHFIKILRPRTVASSRSVKSLQPAAIASQERETSQSAPSLDMDWAEQRRPQTQWCRHGEACRYAVLGNCRFWHVTMPLKHESLIDDGKYGTHS